MEVILSETPKKVINMNITKDVYEPTGGAVHYTA